MDGNASTRRGATVASGEGIERVLVVVPRHPGPLRSLDDDAPDDELDELIDEVFGPTTDERPGAFDAVLLAAGVGVVAWTLLTGAGWVVAGLGITLIVLGVALPARSLLRAAGARRRARREQRLLEGGGAVLDVADPAVDALAQAYEELLDAARLPGPSVGHAAIAAAHAAMLEVASLLDGRPPLSDPERAYVDRRARAIRELAGRLRVAPPGGGRAGAPGAVGDIDAARERAIAVVRARDALEADTGISAVDEIERIGAGLAER